MTDTESSKYTAKDAERDMTLWFANEWLFRLDSGAIHYSWKDDPVMCLDYQICLSVGDQSITTPLKIAKAMMELCKDRKGILNAYSEEIVAAYLSRLETSLLNK